MINTTTSKIFLVVISLMYSFVLSGNTEVDPILQAQEKLEKAKADGNSQEIAEASFELANQFQDNHQFQKSRDQYLYTIEHLDSTNQIVHWAEVHRKLGDAYLRVGSFEESLNAFYISKSNFQKTKNHNRVGELNGRIANVLIAMGDITKAEKILTNAIQRLHKINTSDSMTLANLYLTLGIVNSKKADYKQAISNYEKAESIIITAENRERLLYVYNNISGAYLAYGNNPKALDYLQKTYRIAKEFNHKVGMVSSLGNMAMIAQTQEDHKKALDYLKQSKSINETIGDSAQLARILTNEGQSLKELGRLNEAIQHFEESLSLRRQIGDNPGIASTYLKLGTLNRMLGDHKNAEIYLSESLLIWEEAEDKKGIAECSQELGLLHFAKKNYSSAINFCLKGYKIATAKALIEELKGNCDCLSKAYKAIENYKMAFEYFEKYTDVRDSLFNKDRVEEMTRMEMKYAFDYERDSISIVQKNREALFDAEIQKQKIIRNNSLGGLAAGLLILFILGRNYQQKKKQNKILKEQKTIIKESLEEKEILLKEIHHRVKNNLQVVSSLLSIQSRATKDQSVMDAILEGKSRVQAMALIHQNLYQEGKLIGAYLPSYVNKLARDLLQSYQLSPGKINISQKVAPLTLDVETMVPLGLIINELISNALKYAFKGREGGQLQIEITENNNTLKVIVEDDGIGLSKDFKLEQNDSLGFKLVRAFVEKMKGQLEIKSEQGTSVRFQIPSYEKV